MDADPTLDGWYIPGNIVFGGLIGWLIIPCYRRDVQTAVPAYDHDRCSGLSNHVVNGTFRC